MKLAAITFLNAEFSEKGNYCSVYLPKLTASMFRANAISGQKMEVVLINTRFLCM
jgi:hypothetical protein